MSKINLWVKYAFNSFKKNLLKTITNIIIDKLIMFTSIPRTLSGRVSISESLFPVSFPMIISKRGNSIAKPKESKKETKIRVSINATSTVLYCNIKAKRYLAGKLFFFVLLIWFTR